jgi:hypothetical protein
MLTVVEVFQIEANALQRILGLVGDPEAEEGIAQQPAHQELQRQVTYAPIVVSLHRHPRLSPAFHHAIARGIDDGLVKEWRLGAYRAPPEHAPEVVREVLENGIRGHGQGRRLQQFDIADADSLVRACGHGRSPSACAVARLEYKGSQRRNRHVERVGFTAIADIVG